MALVNAFFFSNSIPCFAKRKAITPIPTACHALQGPQRPKLQPQTFRFTPKLQAAMPYDLLVTHNHVQFLKLRASHWCLSKLLLGYRKGYTSFAKAPCLTKLKKLRKEACLAKFEDPAAQEFSQKGSKECAKESKKTAAMKTDMVVEIQVGDCPVSILCEKAHFEKTDLLVQVEEKQLAAIFQFLEPDLEGMRQEKPEKAAAPKKSKKRKVQEQSPASQSED